jgi:hypothetical protein
LVLGSGQTSRDIRVGPKLGHLKLLQRDFLGEDSYRQLM